MECNSAILNALNKCKLSHLQHFVLDHHPYDHNTLIYLQSHKSLVSIHLRFVCRWNLPSENVVWFPALEELDLRVEQLDEEYVLKLLRFLKLCCPHLKTVVFRCMSCRFKGAFCATHLPDVSIIYK